MYLSLYMDDILIVDDVLDAVNGIKQWLKSRFEMKDMGEAKYVLGIKITYESCPTELVIDFVIGVLFGNHVKTV